jgi:hypothetical protein
MVAKITKETPTPMSEKALFEMRVTRDENGTHVEINASPEWRAYHRPRRRFAWGECWEEMDDSTRAAHHPSAADLRHALDSLQGIYDDLYGANMARADV